MYPDASELGCHGSTVTLLEVRDDVGDAGRSLRWDGEKTIQIDLLLTVVEAVIRGVELGDVPAALNTWEL